MRSATEQPVPRVHGLTKCSQTVHAKARALDYELRPRAVQVWGSSHRVHTVIHRDLALALQAAARGTVSGTVSALLTSGALWTRTPEGSGKAGAGS